MGLASFALALSLLMLASGSACSLLVSAHANHNSRGTYCMQTLAFALVDFGLAAALGVGLAATHEEGDGGAALVAPGVFLASGVIGSISTYRCRRKARKRDHHRGPVGSEDSPAIHTSAPEPERPVPPIEPEEKREPLKPNPLRLPEHYKVSEPQEEPVSCVVGGQDHCPSGQMCVPIDDVSGACRTVGWPRPPAESKLN